MDAQRSEFLTSMIDILERLNHTCVQRGEPLLASVLAIAKGEAEDALRHAHELMALHAMRDKMTSQTSWRAEDQRRVALAAPAYAEDAHDVRHAIDESGAYEGDIAEEPYEPYESYEHDDADEIAA